MAAALAIPPAADLRDLARQRLATVVQAVDDLPPALDAVTRRLFDRNDRGDASAAQCRFGSSL